MVKSPSEPMRHLTLLMVMCCALVCGCDEPQTIEAETAPNSSDLMTQEESTPKDMAVTEREPPSDQGDQEGDQDQLDLRPNGADADVVCIPSQEVCDQVDNDCDGQVDEGERCEGDNNGPREQAGELIEVSGLPPVYNYSGASEARVIGLVRGAIAGLGFSLDDPRGVRPDDLFFVGNHYMAWIDETGFYGKMNGLWRLNSISDDRLDFVMREESGRAVNFLIVGENGAGHWPEGYAGAEHIEFPNRVAESGDDPECGDWCDQYGMIEANRVTAPGIPWWSACNDMSPTWDAHFSPLRVEASAQSLTLIYEGPLVKIADGDGTWDGDACGDHYLFADGQRRPVFLQVGYELHGNEEYFDRTMQFRNQAGNPPFNGPMSLIGGFVFTGWPKPHPLKQISRYVRPEERDLFDPHHDTALRSDQWNPHHYEPLGVDEVWGNTGQALTLSAGSDYLASRSVTLSHIGDTYNLDTGFCFCAIHGALEMGGGLLHGGHDLPIDGGTMSGLARRRLLLAGAAESSMRGIHVYQGETDLDHTIGRADGDGWSADTDQDEAGYLSFGPYADQWGDGFTRAVVSLMVDNNVADDRAVVTLDINDATVDEVIARREVTRREFTDAFAYQDFIIEAGLYERAGHQIEVRAYWHDSSYVKLDKLVVYAAE